MATKVFPDLLSTLGSVVGERGEEEFVSWSVEGWLDDGTFIAMSMDDSDGPDGRILLYLNTNLFSPPRGSSRWESWAIAGVLAASVFFGWYMQHWLWGAGAAAGLFTLSMLIEFIAEQCSVAQRTIDPELWTEKIQLAIGEISKEHRT